MSRRVHVEYLVEPVSSRHGRYWTVAYGGLQHGDFANQGEALTSALHDADHVGRMGHEVDVTVLTLAGTVQDRWRYDPASQRMQPQGRAA